VYHEGLITLAVNAAIRRGAPRTRDTPPSPPFDR